MLKKIFSLLLILAICFSFSSCGKKQSNFSKTIFNYFDTVTTVSGYFDSQEEFNKCFEKIENKLEFYHKLFDIYNSYDGINNIKSINENSGVTPVVVDEKIIELLLFSKDMYNKTAHTVNVCAGPIISLWKNSLEKGKLPMQRDINKTKELIDFNNLLINDEDNTVYLKKKGCSIDVGAVAKGFVCEDIKEFLNSVGFKKGIINIGGNVLIVGEKGEKESFKVGIKNPFGSGNLYNVLVNDKSVVTSGDYERFYEIDGKRYNHIINTNTLSPSSLNKSVTIICNNSALADALSTALFIMDYTEGIKLIDSIENCEALIIDEKGAEYFSSNFEKYLQK